MYKKIFFFFILILSTQFQTHSQHAISYDLGGGRFGDKMLGYAQARYISKMTGIPFLYRPFDFSNQLVIEDNAQPYHQHERRYRHKYHINSGPTLTEFFRQIRNPHTPPTLYIVDYMPADIALWETDIFDFSLYVKGLLLNIPWRNPEMHNFFKNCMRPRIEIPDFTQPGKLNVAVHVRTLSGADVESSLIRFPLKHPTTEYHKRQIQKVYDWNIGRPMRVFIFSDTKQPQNLLEEFRQRFQGYNIEFDIQNLTSPDLNNTVQDFFAMQKFPVLIATQSNFSFMAACLGSYDMIILPVHYRGKHPNYVIDRVQAMSKKSDWFPYDMDIILKDA